ncbi:protein bric-a-brac 2-like isoform X2 [Schistocerca gregaria]|uniref:protein bric-a-brac 2-like isoform X2 n=1 Tax=Schistocerca gregaria TaxID=7010 RepID=UPI00211E9346|nr:protein bric-a-brac 2-like isoform X2 [Schistocerca gregaria]
MGSDQQFCLRWHNYQSNLLATLPQFLDSDNLTDVTLSAGGRSIRAHKVVLSACSQYFNELFKVLHPIQHPVVVIPGTTFSDLCALVTFMYSGEVNIYQEQLQGLLSMADAMQIRGLAEVSGGGKNTVPRKENCGQMKRSRLSMQTPGGTDIMNAEGSSDQCGLQPLQAEPVANNSQYQKGRNDRQQSPPSDDSGGSVCNTDRMQHSSNTALTSLKLKASSGQFSKFYLPNPTTSNTSKLYATCFVCGKQLSNQYNLRVHLETHQNVNYACSVCSHISRSRDALRKHVSYRHPGEAREKVGFGGLIKDARISGGSASSTSKKSKITDNTEDDKPVST